MVFIHNYYPLYTKHLIDIGMAKKGDGFKITQHCVTKPEMKFNVLSKKDSELSAIVSDYASCFYIDRLQGGTYYSEYPYLQEAIDRFNEYTNGNFLGFQLHELGETRIYDWNRIQKQMKETGLTWNEENIIKSVLLVSANKEFPHFSQGSAKEYAALTPPKTLSEYFKDLEYVISSRLKRTNGKILSCDACNIYTGLEKKFNIPVSFIEIGGINPLTRIQFALRRGMSKAASKKWGVYLEPWCMVGPTAYCFMRNGENEWNVTKENFAFIPEKNGGSSMSFAKRAMYYSLFAGSDYFAEEWGQANTFYDFEEFELSPYGKIKKEVIDFSRCFNDIKPTVPCAVILPKEYSVYGVHNNLPFIDDISNGKFEEIRKSIMSLFFDKKNMGNEDILFTCSKFGSVFDIIYEDSYSNPLQNYKFLIDYSGKFAGKSNFAVDGFSKSRDDILSLFLKDFLPFDIQSNLNFDFQIFENEHHHYCCIYNHHGVNKNTTDGETLNPDAYNSVSIKSTDKKIKKVFNICNTDYQHNEYLLNTALKAGEMILFEFE